MSSAIRCDGCGLSIQMPKVNRRFMLPIGWIRLNVTGRVDGAPYASNLDVIELCSPECAEAPIRLAFDKISPVENLGNS